MNLLFIGPIFQSYHNDLIEQINRLGYNTTFLPEKDQLIIDRLLNKISHKAHTKHLNRKLVRRIKQDTTKKHDVVFLIHGQWITNNTIEIIKCKYSGARFIMYQWDSTKTNPNILNILDQFHSAYSFDPIDCLNHKKLNYQQLFHQNFINSNTSSDDTDIDILFVGRAHSDRLIFLDTIKHLYKSNFKIVYRIFMSRKNYYTNRQLIKSLKAIKEEDFIFSKIHYDEVVSLYKRTKAVLDIEHSSQNGLTIRTIEALGYEKKLITTNRNILDESFYSPHQILLVDRNNPSLIPDFIQNEYEPADMAEFRIDNWVKRIIS